MSRQLSIGELATTLFDGPFGSNLKTDDYTDSGTRVVRLENIGHRRFISEKATYISAAKAAGLARHRLLPGDVLFSSFVDEVVRVCLFPDDLPTPAINKADCFCIRVDPRIALPEFVALRLATSETYTALRELVHGATRPRIGLTALKNYRVDVPPLPEQRRIVARIEALFARTRRARADLERITPLSSKYVEAETDRAYDYGTKAGWHVSAAGDLCDIKSGVTLGKRYAPDAELVDRPYLRVANVQRGHLRLDEIKTVRLSAAEADRLTLRPGDVLMNEGGDRDKLGRGWVWSGEIPGCVHQNHVFRLRLRDGRITPRYLSRYANHAGARYFLGEGKQTTNLASISMSKVAALPVPVPPQGEAARIDRKLDAVSEAAARCEQEATRALVLLDRLERSILARAFRGELVPQETSDTNEASPAATSTAGGRTARQPGVPEPA